MKTYLFSLIAITMFGLSSCLQEETARPSNQETQSDTETVLSVCLPVDLGSRADAGNIFSSGQLINTLNYAIYDRTTRNLVSKGKISGTAGVFESLTVRLVNDIDYRIVFFAGYEHASGNGPYTFNAELKRVTRNADLYLISGNLENYEPPFQGTPYPDVTSPLYDCFYKYVDITGGLSPKVNIVLNRPVAQLNIGTDDIGYDAVKAAFGEKRDVLTRVNVSDNCIFTEFDIYEGNVIAASSTNGSSWFRLRPAETENTKFPKEPYVYLSTDYYFVSSSTQTTADIEIVHGRYSTGSSLDSKVEELHRYTVSNVPLKANWQTNIYGSLITGNTSFNIVINPIFDGQTSNMVSDWLD